MAPQDQYRDSGDDATELAERVERLCRAFDRDELDEVLAAARAEDLFEAVLAAIRADTPDPVRVRVALDALDDRLMDVGIQGLTRSNRTFRALPPGLPAPERVWVCPLRQCTRTEARPPARARCAVGGRPLEQISVAL